MPDHAASLNEQKVLRWEVRFKGDLLGLTEDIDLSGVQERWLDKRVGQYGDILLDKVFLGLEGMVKFNLTQIAEPLIRKLTAEAGASGSFSLSPSTPYFSAYGAAGILRLHPEGVADATVTDDINFVKAYPTLKLPGGNRASAAWDKIGVEMVIFPDVAQLKAATPKFIYWYGGAIPT